MEIKTFTNFWAADMKMHSVNDIPLPFPISLRVLGVFFLIAIPWWGMLALFGTPLVAPWHTLWLLPPGGIAFLASGNFFEKKTLLQYTKSRLGYFAEERRYKGLKKDLAKYGTVNETGINIILPLEKETIEG